ncbi:L-ornithine-N5-monooxygenase [Penicillium taxi]|uniref:L-ornithine-N5-monooxygenase n=1 Tax=Penicillium taxi TaxID=168475 RepID=UPI002544F7EA|nr:L-ornithine-N5-monooxygenase [Penicillium taxi]KAJ5901633.1 L-ornithine-N5-monooxygenase [Penicillium taxi]
MVSLHTLRVKSLHDERRRLWSTAFSDKALRGYEQRLQKYQQKLIDHIILFNGQPINVIKWFNMYSFDFMGDLAFGKSFDLLENQDYGAIDLFKNAFHALSFGFPAWFLRLLTAVPGLTRDWWKFIDFCAHQIQQRLENPVATPDITSALSAPLNGKEPTRKEWDLLRGDSQLIVVAGSDTTATTLSTIIYELARNPRHIELLRQELASHVEPSGEVLNENIAKLEHLNGVINEALRLHPVVPTTIQRKTPPEGITIGDVFIPGDTTVICPQYVLGRSKDVYKNPSEFIPERWSTRPDLIIEKSAFAPFSTGPYGCIGRPLALLNIRTTIARLITTFDLSFAPGENGQRFENDAKDAFTIGFGDLMISFRKRS